MIGTKSVGGACGLWGAIRSLGYWVTHWGCIGDAAVGVMFPVYRLAALNVPRRVHSCACTLLLNSGVRDRPIPLRVEMTVAADADESGGWRRG